MVLIIRVTMFQFRRDKDLKPQQSEGERSSGAGALVGKIVGTIVLVGTLSALIFACIFASYIKNDLSEQVDFSVEGFSLDQTSVIYYQDRTSGEWKVLKDLYGEENRVWVSYEDIPRNLKYACVAIEDKRFWDHNGVDWLRSGRAGIDLFMGNKSLYGASTITQQLIKNLTREDEITVRRKIVEIFRALEFEKNYSKEEILEWYLNIIPLGQRCYGVQSAALTYFGKDVEDLTLAECAALIGITNNPSMYNPYINPENNRERQLWILYEMLDQGVISQEEYDEAVAQEMVFIDGTKNDDPSASYFTYFEDQVIDEVVRDLMEKTGYEYQQALQMLQTGGYKIYSTIDPAVQAEVDKVYQNLDNIPETASSQLLQSGIVVTDNETGDIVALAGGVGPKVGSLIFNRATQSRLSPGSIIKPITVFAPALDMGLISPATVYDDTPSRFVDLAAWPKNSDSTYRGLVSVNDAMCYSLNTVAVKIVNQITPEVSYHFAKDKMGLSNLVEDYVSNTGVVLSDVNLAPMAMGGLTLGVTVRDMAAAYGTFANDGIYREARCYTRVVDSSGQVVLDNTQDANVAMKESTAWYSTYMMENVVSYGTGTGAKLDNMAVAGKTGTTTSNYDRWFAGYTPYYTAVVWCGYDDPEEVVLTDTTENPAITLWNKVMTGIHEDLPRMDFDRPTDVVTATYCADSGKLATDACRADPRGDRTVSGLLALTDVPTESCTLHQMVDICSASDHVANEYCGKVAKLYKMSLICYDRQFPISGVVVQDQGYVVRKTPLEPGFYEASAPKVDSVSMECYIHTEEDVKDEEEEESRDGTVIDWITDLFQ